MDIFNDWKKIKRHFNVSFRSNFHVSFGSMDGEGVPVVTPIGSLFLNNDLSGFYFEKYPVKLPQHAEIGNKISVLAVNSGVMFWLKSLFRGQFSSYPGVRLYGQLGERRAATDKELARLKRRMRATRWLKGNATLWGEMPYVREVKFNRAEKINLGDMTSHL